MISEYNEIALIKSTQNSIISLVIKDNQIYVKKLSRGAAEINAGYQHISSLRHRNIAYVVETEASGEQFAVIQQYVAGKTLEEELEHRSAWHKNELIDLMVQLCDGVSFLHECDCAPLIHRDLKPSNIMLNEDNVLKIVDFGTLRFKNENGSRDTQILGTFGFAPPEQFGFSQTGEQADLYSIGVIMYQLITGDDIKVGCSIRDQMNIAQKKIPFGMKKIILKCTEIDPGRRYKSVDMLKFDLHRERLKFPLAYLPGFRSGKWWKSVLSLIFLICFIPELIRFHAIQPYFMNMFTAFLILAIPYAAVTNIFYIMDYFPKYANSYLVRKIYIAVSIVISLVILYFEDLQYFEFFS